MRRIICRFTGEMLGNIMELVLANDDFKRASTVMEKLDKNHHVILGVPNFEALSTYVNHCIEMKSPTQAIVSTRVIKIDSRHLCLFFNFLLFIFF